MDKRIRKLVTLDRVLAQRINDFRHAQRIDTESAAIRRLILRGLLAEKETPTIASELEKPV